jgi:hypothetical protein
MDIQAVRGRERTVAALAMLLAWLSVACSTGLSRADAERLLGGTDLKRSASFQFPLGERLYDRQLQLVTPLIQNGYLTLDRNNAVRLSPKGQAALDTGEWRPGRGVPGFLQVSTLVEMNLGTGHPKVTGLLRTSDSEALVQFVTEWEPTQWGQLVPPAQAIDNADVFPRGPGCAVLHKYDDGWRFVTTVAAAMCGQQR